MEDTATGCEMATVGNLAPLQQHRQRGTSIPPSVGSRALVEVCCAPPAFHQIRRFQPVASSLLNMAWRYIKMRMCGTSTANRREEEELKAVATALALGLGNKRRWGGSVFGHAVKNRKREEVNEQIMRDYFNENPLFGEEDFRRRFRMRKSLFLRIVDDVTRRNKYFKQKRNAAKKLGFTPIHKCLIAMRILAYVNSCFCDILGLAHLDRLKKLATAKNSALQPRDYVK